MTYMMLLNAVNVWIIWDRNHSNQLPALAQECTVGSTAYDYVMACSVLFKCRNTVPSYANQPVYGNLKYRMLLRADNTVM